MYLFRLLPLALASLPLLLAILFHCHCEGLVVSGTQNDIVGEVLDEVHRHVASQPLHDVTRQRSTLVEPLGSP